MPQPLSQLSPSAIQGAGGQAILDRDCGVVTTEGLTTAAGATLTYTVFCKEVRAPGDGSGSQAGSIPLVTLLGGSNSQGDPSLQLVTVSQGKLVITVVNRHATQAFNGSLRFAIAILN